MALLREAGRQAVILRSYAALGSRDDSERHRAMEAMRECGTSARWCLRLALRQTGQPRVQFAAVVVLYRQGDRQGLMVLTEALKWRLASEPLIAPELESAFVSIGSPDAISVLLTVWNMLPDWGDHEAVRASICRVWAALRNPLVLPALATGALLNPDRFERTVPAFGGMAIPILRDMARAQDMRRRCLAAQTLRHIPGRSAFAILVPLLRDTDPRVRELIPAALERIGSQAPAIAEISKAVRAGFTSVDALVALNRFRPSDLTDTLTCLLETWCPVLGDSNDTEIALMALSTLADPVVNEGRVLRALCGLLEKPIDARVAVALMQAIEALARASAPPDQGAMETVFRRLTTPNAEVREQAALTLARLGDLFPARVIAFLEDCRPQDSFLSQLQLILRGGRDAGQAATQAVQQVSKWWARLTADSPDLRRIPSELAHVGADSAASDPRLPDILRRMLADTARREPQTATQSHIDEKTAFLILILRALSRLGMPAAECAWSETVAALHLPAAVLAVAGSAPDLKAHEAVSDAAAETLMALYGADSYCLFLEALYSPRIEVVRTGIRALGLLGDSRGLQHLRRIAANDRHPCMILASQAIAQIKHTNPEIMSLLRGSSATLSDPGVLLRAARGNTTASSSDLLLRPTAQHSD